MLLLLAGSGRTAATAAAAKLVLNAGTVALRRPSPRPLCTKPPPSGLYGADKQQSSGSNFSEPLRPRNVLAEWALRAMVVGFFGGITYLVFTRYKERASRRESFQALPKLKGVKADLHLVKFCDCVLSEDMVMSGTMNAVSRFEMRPDDVIVASFPKSGTTWLQEVVRLLYKEDLNAPDKHGMETLFPYLEHVYPGIKEIANRKGRRFIKTHLPYHLLPESVDTVKPKVLYIYRNPKDVAVSYFHFAQMLTFVKYRGTFEEFADLFIRDEAPYSPYFPHVRTYLTLSKSRPSQYLAVSFEDMKADPVKAVRHVADFLGVEADEARIHEVVRRTSFNQMKENPVTNYKHWDAYGLRDPKFQEFMRKGEVGDFANYFQKDSDLNSRFDKWVADNNPNDVIPFKFTVESS